MFDFPNAPVLNQQVLEPNGAVLRWDGVKWVNAAGQVSSVTPTYNNVGRNLIHNPLFNIAQRGNGPWTAGAFTMDRWTLTISLDTTSITRQFSAEGDRSGIGDEADTYHMQNVFAGNAAAGSYTFVTQAMEGLRRFAGKTITVSFWARALSGTPKLGINSMQNWGSGGSPTASAWSLATGATATLSTTWTRYTVTYSIPSSAGKSFGTNGDDSLGLSFWFSAGANQSAVAGNIGVQSGTVSLWGVQLEVGSVATPLEKPDPQQDLAKCQRFFCTATTWAQGNNTAGTAVGTSVALPMTMRATPTVALSVNNNTNISAPALAAISNTLVAEYGSPGSSGNWTISGVLTASADL